MGLNFFFATLIIGCSLLYLFLTYERNQLCDECKTGFPAKCFIQEVDTWLLVCADCSEKLNRLPIEQTVYPDISKEGFYEAEFS